MVDDLLELTVSEQKNELENLSKKELKNLREQESRQTALDNIRSELLTRDAEDGEEKAEESEPVEDNQEPLQADVEPSVPQHIIDKQRELRHKVDYLIDRCKTTSEQGFENYEAE